MRSSVLVVDDRRSSRRALAAELEDAGFEVIEAEDGSHGWSRFCTRTPDLVITDMVMPNSDGIDLLTRFFGFHSQIRLGHQDDWISLADGRAHSCRNGVDHAAPVRCDNMMQLQRLDCGKGLSCRYFIALCDVDEVRAARNFERYAKAPKYKDFRVMLDKEGKSIDAITIGIPDHMHATAALACMHCGCPTFRWP